MLGLNIFGRKKLFLAFEFGVILAKVAQKHEVELTPEIIERAEKMIENEFRHRTPTQLSLETEILILSVFELDVTK